MEGKLLRVAVMLTALSAASCAYGPLATQPEAEPVIALCRDRAIHTKPFRHSTVSVKDTEDIVHVPGDDNLWIGDDISQAVFELDRRSGHYRSRITEREIVDAFPEVGRCGDGDRDSRTSCSYTGEMEILAYDPDSGTLFVFNTHGSRKLDPREERPAVFRLQKKHGRGKFQLLDWQALPAGQRVGPAVVIERRLYLAIGGDVVEYDVERNRLADIDEMGNPVPALHTSVNQIVGMAFDGSSLWILTGGKELVQVDWSSKEVVGSYDIAPFGISKAKGLTFGEGEFFVVDGDPPNLIHVLRFGRRAGTAWWRGGGQSLSCG
jgi:hypothetical protein